MPQVIPINGPSLVQIMDSDGNILDSLGSGGESSTGATGTSSSPTITTSVSTILNSNSSRNEYSVYNPSTSSVNVLIKRGTGASSSSYTFEIVPGATLIDDRYSGAVTAITRSASATIQVSEIS